MIVGGHPHIRRSLQMATVTAIKHNPVIRAFFHRLIAAGRPGKVAVTAAMRKLLTILNAMLRDRRPWQIADSKDSRSRLKHGAMCTRRP
jgi:transposase